MTRRVVSGFSRTVWRVATGALFGVLVGHGLSNVGHVLSDVPITASAQGTCDRMASAFGAATSSETDRSRACYVTFRAAGVFFIIVGIGLFCVAAWHLLAT